MSRFNPLTIGLALPLSFMAQAALADLTPQQVWGDWQAYMQSMGYTVQGTPSGDDDLLTVEGINLGVSMADVGGTVQVALGTVTFEQNSDGTVAIVLPDTMPITVTGMDTTAQGEAFSMAMTYAQTGHEMTASGTPENITYDYTAADVTVDLLQTTTGGANPGHEMANIQITLGNLDSSTTMTIGDMRGYDQTGSVDTVSYRILGSDPMTREETATINGEMTGITVEGSGSLPADIASGADMSAMIGAGFDVTGKISYASGKSNIAIEDPNGGYLMNTTSNGGDFGVAVGADGLTYEVAQRDLTLNMTGNGVPFPVDITMAESGFNLSMPVQKSDDPQDFALGLKFGDFTMSDMIWSVFDPAGQLPRDPATIALDLTGKMKLLVDFMNPEAAAKMQGAPGELQALNLNTVLVSAAGAKLEGTGAVTFDGNAPSMVPGLGAPVGEVNLAMSGANGLIDKLVAMGLLPSDQAMGARMMMGLFAVAGASPDTLNSKIEFTQDGQILANGQRLR
ncbi:DUF2125 domain containing protein [Sulfitobacter noctilucae]|uniref:DUF2125 domain-containing protein n=1 Tax=Sulfitobacter noctilucae TaxID=1342302 RepID=UPI00046AA97C|nr:DUF2125 domain-containing protein [Sulfitobacter noctilucae]KIN75295.1 DUF2125 domain containing protein [Sulfitobacter noctilucae]